jgi:cytochrome c oxidase cbb3-type subunit 3
MRHSTPERFVLIAAFLLLLVLSGCNQGPVESAAAGSPPGVRIPVGPIPGPGKEDLNLPQNPYTGNGVALHEGRRLFDWYNCSGCHGGHGGGGMGPSLRDPVWRYGSSDAHIFASIAEGRGEGMPAWGTRIPEEQIWKLVAYIKSLRTAQEPDKPEVPPIPEVKEAQQAGK